MKSAGKSLAMVKASNRTAMRRAVADFLRAAGFDTSSEDFKKAPLRVVDAWFDEFLSGYRQTAANVLKERFPTSSKAKDELIVVTGLHFRSMCPHHLMLYEGTAHLAYVPNKSLVGFGRLAELLNVFAHRLILQEELVRSVATALMNELHSQGAACVTSARQTCFRLRGQKQHEAMTHCEAYEGILQRPTLRTEFWQKIELHKRFKTQSR